MPYKNPDRKRQWEHEHREQRNEQRRLRRVEVKSSSVTPNAAPDTVSFDQGKSAWKGIIAFGAAVAVVAIAVFSGINIPGTEGPSHIRS